MVLILFIESVLIIITLFTILSFVNFKFQYPKFNTYTISYYIFLFVFSLLIRKPFFNYFSAAAQAKAKAIDLGSCFAEAALVYIYYILFLIIILITLNYFRNKLWVILSYSVYKLLRLWNSVNVNVNVNTAVPAKAKTGLGNGTLHLQASVPLSGILAIEHDNSTTASRCWAKRALIKKEEADKLELVLNKLDVDRPLASGISRSSGFISYIGDLYSEALRFDYIARRNQYRKMIMSEPRFTVNDSSEDISSILE